MYTAPIARKIIPLIEPSLEAMGYRLVRIHWQEGRRPTLQIMAERLDGEEMTVEDCSDISHTVSALLDVEDPIESAYHLEISSPGIDRPLMTMEDFATHLGHEAKIEMQMPVNGRKRFRGILAEADKNAEMVVITVDQQRCELPFAAMFSAKLVMTEELMRAALRESDARKAQKEA